MNNLNDDLDDTNDSSGGAPGDAMDGRATMVPPSGLNYVSYLFDICRYHPKSLRRVPRGFM